MRIKLTNATIIALIIAIFNSVGCSKGQTKSPVKELEHYFESSKTLYVNGEVDLRRMTADFLPFHILDEEISHKAEGKFSVEYLDSNGNLMYKINFTKTPMHDMPENNVVFGFDQELPLYSDVKRIRFRYDEQILRLKYGNKFITEFEISENSPKVELLSPNKSVVNRTDGVRWNATDPDNDLLSIIISYSDDNGKTWEPLSDVRGVSPTTKSYPLNDYFIEEMKYLINVEATDGINFGSDVSKPFSIQSSKRGEPTSKKSYPTIKQIIAHEKHNKPRPYR